MGSTKDASRVNDPKFSIVHDRQISDSRKLIWRQKQCFAWWCTYGFSIKYICNVVTFYIISRPWRADPYMLYLFSIHKLCVVIPRSIHKCHQWCQLLSLKRKTNQYINKFETRTNLSTDVLLIMSQIAKFMWPTWDPPGSCRPQIDKWLETLSKQMLAYCSLDRRKKFQWTLNRNKTFFIQINDFDNIICKMVAILSRPKYVKCHLWHVVYGPLHEQISVII